MEQHDDSKKFGLSNGVAELADRSAFVPSTGLGDFVRSWREVEGFGTDETAAFGKLVHDDKLDRMHATFLAGRFDCLRGNSFRREVSHSTSRRTDQGICVTLRRANFFTGVPGVKV